MHTLRLIRLLILALFDRRPRSLLRPTVCRFRITPFDVELTTAVSHAYLAFAGLGRWSWNFRNVHWHGLLKERWSPFTHSELVYYRRAAKLFSRLEMTTTLIWWDDKMAYFEHRMTQGDVLCALVYSRGACFKGRERVPLRDCAHDVPEAPPMAKPAIVDVWATADAHFRRHTPSHSGE